MGRRPPGRPTEQALLVLACAIDQAWLKDKVVILVAFDLKGAFNGVNKMSLDTRLREKGIPIKVRWIQSFVEGRSRSIKYDDFETELAPLENAGLAQGSLLLLIPFTLSIGAGLIGDRKRIIRARVEGLINGKILMAINTLTFSFSVDRMPFNSVNREI
jgi:hypothetical protein